VDSIAGSYKCCNPIPENSGVLVMDTLAVGEAGLVGEGFDAAVK
jgi:hypothetical protein